MTNTFDWTIVGAGPAGIAAVGKLLDHGVPAQQIAWVDPNFQVGDFGEKWRNVSSNTKVGLFIQFLEACECFRYIEKANDYELSKLNPEDTCKLSFMADALLCISELLEEQVATFKNLVEKLDLNNGAWTISLKGQTITSKNVVLAIGAEPKILSHDLPAEYVPLEDAMDLEKLKHHCKKQDTIAVFGSSHSAILVIKDLVELGVKRVINFYQSPLRYAVYLDDGTIFFDNTGLKGTTATWAKDNIDGKMPENLERILSNEENLRRYLPECDKSIYAVGFKTRPAPVVNGGIEVKHNKHCGIIAPGLFGFGIAYPETTTDQFGVVEQSVGLWKFMRYLDRVLPVWLQYSV